MKTVAAREYRTEEEIRDLVAKVRLLSAPANYIPALTPTVWLDASHQNQRQSRRFPVTARL